MKNLNKKYIIIAVLTLILIGMIVFMVLSENKSNNTISSADVEELNVSTEFKDEDLDINWRDEEYKDIELTESISITSKGVYHLTGTIENGMITVNVGDDDTVKLVLDNVSITNSNGPTINVENAKKVIIILEDGTTNTLVDGEQYNVSDEDIDACIFSKDNLVINGNGTLNVTANYKDGIVSKDNIKIIGTNININAKDDGIRGKDYVVIKDANITIYSVADGIKSTNDTEEDKGYIVIENSKINITSGEDGIQAETNIKITGGEYKITTGGGSGELTAKDAMQGFKQTNTSSTTEDETSIKAIKAGKGIEIESGTFEINSSDDGIHSNETIKINGGTFTVKSGDDGIHADGMIEINDGTYTIIAAEGIEATYVKINEGTINISASDDGINAGNKSSNYTVTIEINGGEITINMGSGDTDAIDSNGNLYINGGTINITANSPFDYDGVAKLNGGTLIVNGEETNTITNQFMGGGMQQGGMQRMH